MLSKLFLFFRIIVYSSISLVLFLYVFKKDINKFDSKLGKFVYESKYAKLLKNKIKLNLILDNNENKLETINEENEGRDGKENINEGKNLAKNLIKVQACVGRCLFSKIEDKKWNIFYENFNNLSNFYTFSVFDENSNFKSKMLILLNDEVYVYLHNKAKLSFFLENDTINLDIHNSCVALNTTKTKSQVFIKNIGENVSINGVSYFCKDFKEIKRQELGKNILNFLDIKDKFVDYREKEYQLMLPCDDDIVIESTKKVSFTFNSPILGNKVFQISNDQNFSSLNSSFNIKNYYSYEVLLAKGDYFWRIKNSNSSVKSKKCRFSLRDKKDISLIQPKQFDVISNDQKFSWYSDKNINSYKIIFSNQSDFSNIIYSKKLNQTSTTIDNLENNLGTGVFYWKIETDKQISSLARKFFIYTKDNIVFYEPKINEQFVSKDKFIKIKANNLYNVNKYKIEISNDLNFNKLIYENDSNIPTFYVPNFGTNKYFYRIIAKFNNQKELISNYQSFIISDSDFIKILKPLNEKEYFISGSTLLMQWICPGEGRNKSFVSKNYKITLNDKEFLTDELKIENNICNYNLKYKFKEKNIIKINEICKNNDCKKSKEINFYVKKDKSPKLIIENKYNALPLNRKGYAKIYWTKTKNPVEFKLFDIDKNLINESSTDKNFIVYKLDPGTYFIRLKETSSNMSDFQKFKVIGPRPAMPVRLAPVHRKVAKANTNVKFIWKKTKNAKAYELRIYNKNLKKPIKIKTEKLSVKKKFYKGTYYWNLFSYDYIEDKIRYSKGTKKRMLIVR